MYTEYHNQYRIEIGRNDLENDRLVENAHPRSLWFHVKDIPSPHGILTCLTDDRDYPRDMIEKCASLVKRFSRVKHAPNAKIEYITTSHVALTNTLGMVTLDHDPKIVVI
jgi:predicted ribosome quality control (RQC) complex YloA/Tae2 family protein